MGVMIGAASLAGCGSNSSNAAATDAATQPLTKKEFIQRAETACVSGLKKKDQVALPELQKLALESRGIPDPKKVAKIVEDSVLPIYRNIVAGLGQLNPPKGDEAQVEKIVREFEQALEKTEAAPAKAAEVNAFAAANEAARAYGMEACRL